VVDQWVTTSTTNFATLSMMTAMMSLMRPRFTLALFGLAYVAFYNLLPLTQPDADLLAIARSQSLGALVMSVVVSIIVWRQYVVSVLLRREIVVANQALTAKQVELAVMATRDSLTGLFVRREFMRLAEMELARAARFSNDTGVLMVDLDFFKRINDQYGHPAGDEVLQQVANLLSAGVRATDVVGRLGGEEFIVLMPNTSVEGALSVAEKLRTSLRSEPLKIAGLLIPVTASIGVSAQVHQLAVSVEGLYAAADRALYVAKKSGRDRVEYAAPVEPAAA
jgi:diguanylate cyclase (GGDEF)-like protein